MHSFLKAVGFSKVTKREEMKEIILDVIKNYDEKNVVEDNTDGVFAQFSQMCIRDREKSMIMWDMCCLERFC